MTGEVLTAVICELAQSRHFTDTGDNLFVTLAALKAYIRLLDLREIKLEQFGKLREVLVPRKSDLFECASVWADQGGK